MIKLFVNVDHVATVREARKTYEPDPLEAAIIAEQAGAYGITATCEKIVDMCKITTLDA